MARKLNAINGLLAKLGKTAAPDIPTAIEQFGELDYIVLKSSTESSTKKFKITVVDAGTISATELS